MSYRYRLEVFPDQLLTSVMDQMDDTIVDASDPKFSWFHSNGEIVRESKTSIYWKTTDPIPHWEYRELAIAASEVFPEALITVYGQDKGSTYKWRSAFRGGYLVDEADLSEDAW